MHPVTAAGPDGVRMRDGRVLCGKSSKSARTIEIENDQIARNLAAHDGDILEKFGPLPLVNLKL
jgi:hypothetical protein